MDMSTWVCRVPDIHTKFPSIVASRVGVGSWEEETRQRFKILGGAHNETSTGTMPFVAEQTQPICFVVDGAFWSRPSFVESVWSHRRIPPKTRPI